MRKLPVAIALVVMMAAPFTVSAQAPKSRTACVGIIVGEPTGLSLKFWLDKVSAIDAAVAWTFLPENAMYVHADYLYHFYNLIPLKSGALPIYVGAGASATVKATPTIGIRIPVGIDYLFPHAPLDAFLEVGIGVSVYPAFRFLGSGAIGVRYDF